MAELWPSLPGVVRWKVAFFFSSFLQVLPLYATFRVRTDLVESGLLVAEVRYWNRTWCSSIRLIFVFFFSFLLFFYDSSRWVLIGIWALCRFFVFFYLPDLCFQLHLDYHIYKFFCLPKPHFLLKKQINLPQIKPQHYADPC